MNIGFEVVAAKREKIDDAPVQVPMRGTAKGQVRRNPSTDQKKVRRSLQRKTAGPYGSADNSPMDLWWQANDLAADTHDASLGAVVKATNNLSLSADYADPRWDVRALMTHLLGGVMAHPQGEELGRKIQQSLQRKTADLGSREKCAFCDNPATIEARQMSSTGTHVGTVYVCDDHADASAATSFGGGSMNIRTIPGTTATKETSMSREADLLAKMAAATSLAEQREYAAELETLRHQRTAAAREEASLDLANTVVSARFPTLAPAQFTQHTAATDWLAEVEPETHDARRMEASMRAEATVWFDARPAEVKADRDELWAQAVGIGSRLASGYGLQSDAAAEAFMGQVRHLAGIKRRAFDEVQKPPFNAPEHKVDYPDSPDTFDDSISTPADPKSTSFANAPSLAEGDTPEGDRAESVNDAPAASNTHSEGTGTGPSTDYLDGTQTQSHASRKTAEGDPKSTGFDNAPSLAEGDAPEGDSAQPAVEDNFGGLSDAEHDHSGGEGAATDSIDGTVYPKQSAFRAVAARIAASPVPEAAQPWVQAMAHLDGPADSFAGIPAAAIVAFYLKHASAEKEALEAILAGQQVTAASEYETMPLHVLADVIRRDWNAQGGVHYTAKPYLEAMGYLNEVSDRFGEDDGNTVIAYFLSNARTWKGDLAREVKAALKARAEAYRKQRYAAKTAADDAQTCATCGDKIAKDPSGEDNSTWHHDNGEKHDHEATPGGEAKESAKTAGQYQGGSPKEGDTATCHKDGGAIQFFDGQWMHLKGTGGSHNDVHPDTPKEQAEKSAKVDLPLTGNARLAAFAATVARNI